MAEAPGAEEVARGRPLVGPSGRLLNALLTAAGIERTTVVVANVFRHRPDRNDVSRFFVDAARAAQQNVRVSDAPPFRGRVLRHLFATELHVLHETLDAWAPRAVVALGAVPTWALTGIDRVTALAGTVIPRTFGSVDTMVLPTFHPASALPGRSPENRDTILATLRQARHCLNRGDVP